MKPAYSFKEQLSLALPGEAIAITEINKIPGFENFIHKPGKSSLADAQDEKKQEWLELKIDMTSYPNHFIERYSSKYELKPGGPWQYLEKGVRYYAFCYLKLREIHIFDTATLVVKMEELLKTGAISDFKHGKDVKQIGGRYVTYGYAIPKSLLNTIEMHKIKY